MKNLPPELIAKVKAAKSAEELLALAKENNVELTEEEAKTYFEQLNANENATVSDEELNDVSGGAAYIEFGGFGATIQMGGESRVRLINGKSCSSCGGTIGKIAYLTVLGAAYSGVKCEKCNTVIVETYTADDIEII
jgi:hypothetical protein